jgi:hypothetical protein
MILRWSRVAVPAGLTGRLADDEVITALATTEEGPTLATTRRGLWVVDQERASRLGWDRIAKATLNGGVLTLVPLVAGPDVDDPDVIGRPVTGPDGAAEVNGADAGVDPLEWLQVVRDGPAIRFRLARPAKVTDQVHNRVRRSVAASRYLPWPGAGGWVALRRVPGQDGLTAQLRLDPSAEPSARGFLAAARQVATELRTGPTSGTTGVD